MKKASPQIAFGPIVGTRNIKMLKAESIELNVS